MSRWIYGKHAVLERLAIREPGLEFVVLAKGLHAREAEEVERAAKAKGLKVLTHPKEWLTERCETDRHQGVAASAKDFKYTELSDILKRAPAHTILVVLDGVEDPHNLGAVLRSAECAGACGVVIPRDRAVQVTAAVEKVSAGAAAVVPVAAVVNLSRALDEIKQAGFWSYGFAGEAQESLYAQKLDGKVCLVMGAEGKGLRDLVAKNCDKLLKIPMAGQIESLNVSVAAGVAMFEVVRQRGK